MGRPREKQFLLGAYGKVEAKLVSATESAMPTKKIGVLAGKLVVPEDFDAPLPDEVLQTFEGCSRMRLLLDTNVLLWTLAGSPKIQSVSQLILAPESEVFVSTASLWESSHRDRHRQIDGYLTEIRQAVAASGFCGVSI